MVGIRIIAIERVLKKIWYKTSCKGKNRSTGVYGRLKGIYQKTDYKWTLKNVICLYFNYKAIRK